MLDTNICIYFIKRKPESLFQKIHAVMEDGLAISSITLAELEYGVALSEQKERNANALAQFLVLISVLPFEETAAEEYGTIRAALRRQGTPIGALDELIAAHAKANDMILVTNNTREFERVKGLKLENWAE